MHDAVVELLLCSGCYGGVSSHKSHKVLNNDLGASGAGRIACTDPLVLHSDPGLQAEVSLVPSSTRAECGWQEGILEAGRRHF